MLNRLMKLMGEDASIDDDLYQKIFDNMLMRLKDKVTDIRSQAVTALQRLQDPRYNIHANSLVCLTSHMDTSS